MKTFFGFAIAASMFSGEGTISFSELTPETAKGLIASGVVPCLNPSHAATIAAMSERYGIDVEIPATAPQVVLEPGDALLVMGVRGLPRLDASRHEYTHDEIARAAFTFQLFKMDV